MKTIEKNISERKLILSLFIISIIIRFFYGIYFYSKNGTSLFVDDWVYIEFAKSMLSQGIFVSDISSMTPTRSGVTPFYPFIIFLSFKLFGIKYLPLIILNALFSASLTVITFYIGKVLINKSIGLLSAIWTLFYVNSIRWVPTLLKENLIHLLFALLMLLILYILYYDKSIPILIFLSLIFTLLIHTDERYIIYSILILIAVFLINQKSFKQKIFYSLMFISMTFIFMLPWLIRNYNVYGRPVILSERTAVITDKYIGYTNPNNFSQEIQVSDATLDSIKKGLPVHDMTMYNLIQRGLSYGTFPERHSKMEKAYIDFKELWRPFRFSNMWVSEGFRPEGKWSFSHNVSIILTYGILLPFFLIGVYYSIKEWNKPLILLTFAVVLHTLLHITFVLSQNRYRISLDVIIIVIAFYGLSEIYNYYRKRKINV